MSVGYTKRKRSKKIGPIIDKINIILSAVIIICGVVIVLDIRERLFMFPVMFSIAALMNGLLAFKCYKMAEMGRMLILLTASALLIALSATGFIVTLN